MSKVSCFTKRMSTKQANWFDIAEKTKKPWTKFDNSYTRFSKLIHELEHNKDDD